MQTLDKAAQQLTSAAVSGNMPSSPSVAFAPPAPPSGSRRSKWKTAATTVIAVDRMRRTVVFVVTSEPGQADQRHAIEIVGLGQTTVAQLREKIQGVVALPPSHQEIRVKGKLVEGDESATLSHVGIAALADIYVHNGQRAQARHPAAGSTQGIPAAAATHFQSAETMALRSQVQQLQQQLTVRVHSHLPSCETLNRPKLCTHSASPKARRNAPPLRQLLRFTQRSSYTRLSGPGRPSWRERSCHRCLSRRIASRPRTSL